MSKGVFVPPLSLAFYVDFLPPVIKELPAPPLSLAATIVPFYFHGPKVTTGYTLREYSELGSTVEREHGTFVFLSLGHLTHYNLS